MGYTKSQQGESTVFQTDPERAPIPLGALNVAVVPAFILYFVHWMAAVGLLLFFGFCIWVKTASPTVRRYRKPSRFIVSSEGVQVEGKTIDRRDIHRVRVKNHVLAEGGSSDVILLSNDFVSASGAAADRTMAKYNRKLGAVSYRVDVEAGGKATTLAGGFEEATAFGVLSDVSRILGLSAS